jgi:hypothetical protein
MNHNLKKPARESKGRRQNRFRSAREGRDFPPRLRFSSRHKKQAAGAFILTKTHGILQQFESGRLVRYGDEPDFAVDENGKRP